MLSTGSSPTFASLILWLLTQMANSLPSDVSNEPYPLLVLPLVRSRSLLKSDIKPCKFQQTRKTFVSLSTNISFSGKDSKVGKPSKGG